MSEDKIKYKRILLKLSGEILGDDSEVLSSKVLKYTAEQICSVQELGVKVGIVIGGGNIIRGRNVDWFDRIDADYCGMVSTVVNGIALYSCLRKRSVYLRGSFEVGGMVKKFDKFEDGRLYDNGGLLILVGGTGNPTVSTDTAAAIRAAELSVDILIKGTNVEGVYTADPKKDKNARLLNSVSYEEAIRNNLNVMDIIAFKICQELGIKIYVYNFLKYPLKDIILGKSIGTIVG
uniref:Uridylate kinase n=1 Tax=candidate division WOR-3 bacterium TaxID=2052148 RepID=A0A7V3RG49_UNCW3